MDWDDFLPPVLFAYRASQHDTTGFSPFYLETGRFPSLPAGTLVGEHRESDAESGVEWADRITQRLETAFTHVRTAQEETARKNRDRKATQLFAPNFQKGDVLFLWETTGEETRLRDDIKLVTGHTGKLPTKLTNKWSGPYPFVRMLGDRYAVVLEKGEEVCHNVNRLWRHQPWDEWHPDTGIAQEKDGGREEQKSVQGGKEKEKEGTEAVVGRGGRRFCKRHD